MVATTTPVTIPDTLRTLHNRVALGFVYLQTNRRHSINVKKAERRLTDLVVQDYLPALNALIEPHGREALEAHLAHVETRLGNGSHHLGRSAGKRIDDAYLELITDYEILFDALRTGQHPDTFLSRVYDRIEGIRPETQAVSR